MIEIVVASKNKGKVSEIAGAFANLPITVLALSTFGDIPEANETGETFEENAIIKAKYYSEFTGKACLADDSGLEVDALRGAPGIYSARFAGTGATDSENNSKLLTLLDDVPYDQRTARFRCVLALVDTGGNVMTTDGVCEGIILDSERGSLGFGYDPLFYLPHFERTMAELSLTEKNSISHRGKALGRMANKLAGYL